MLNPNSMADVAAIARDRSGMGASITCGCQAVPRDRAAAVAAARPQASTVAVHVGTGCTAAGQAEPSWQQRTTEKYAHTTRIATAGGGSLGPHPARDPV